MNRRGPTTFVLGAGASRHAGYPFVGTMGSDLLAWMKANRDGILYDFADTAAFIEGEFGNHIENIFNGVDERISHRGDGWGLLANQHKPALVEAMRRWFADLHQNDSASAYRSFAANVVRSGDTVITFNYDVALDSKLQQFGKWSVGDGYGFLAEPLPTGSSVKLLKLHGSINWLALLFGGARGAFAFPRDGAFGCRPAFGSEDLSALGYTNLTDPLLGDGAAAVLRLILPTSRKDFFFQTNLGREWEGFWNHLWAGARIALEQSDRIVVCGYGMYPIDERGRDLLLRGDLHGDFEVCCGADSTRIVKELCDCGRKVRVSEEVFFERWVAAQE